MKGSRHCPQGSVDDPCSLQASHLEGKSQRKTYYKLSTKDVFDDKIAYLLLSIVWKCNVFCSNLLFCSDFLTDEAKLKGALTEDIYCENLKLLKVVLIFM